MKKHISLRFPLAGDESYTMLQRITIDGDKARLEQVLRNFLSNALKFTPENGSVEVKASVVTDTADSQPQRKSQTFLRIEVIDSGPGIAKVRGDTLQTRNAFLALTPWYLQENIPKLFNEIVQFDAEKLQRGGGSGFGLWSECHCERISRCL